MSYAPAPEVDDRLAGLLTVCWVRGADLDLLHRAEALAVAVGPVNASREWAAVGQVKALANELRRVNEQLFSFCGQWVLVEYCADCDDGCRRETIQLAGHVLAARPTFTGPTRKRAASCRRHRPRPPITNLNTANGPPARSGRLHPPAWHNLDIE